MARKASRKNHLNEVNKIEEQIRDLQQRKKNLIEQVSKEIGQYLMETWKIEDTEQARKLIDQFREQAAAEAATNRNEDEPAVVSGTSIPSPVGTKV